MLKKKDFAEWLEDNRFEIVGVRQEADRCPIARYWLDTHPQTSSVSVDGDFLVHYNAVQGREYISKLPKWAKKFVVEVDKLPDIEDEDPYDDDYNDLYDVTGEEALAVLEKIV